MRPDELAAGILVAAHTGAVVDGDPLVGNHDVDLTLPSGRTIGIEVTRAADEDEVATWAAIAQRRRNRHPLLSRWWSVALHSGANVTRAHVDVPALLAQLEAAEISEFRWLSDPFMRPSSDSAVAAIESRLLALGVDHAHSLVPKNGVGGLSFVAHKSGGAVSANDLLDAIEHEAWKDDNRTKLREMPRDEAHLFLWIDHTNRPAHGVLTMDVLPIPEPELPAELDVLWVAARYSSTGRDWVAAGARKFGAGKWARI